MADIGEIYLINFFLESLVKFRNITGILYNSERNLFDKIKYSWNVYD